MQKQSFSQQENIKRFFNDPRVFILAAWLPMLLLSAWMMTRAWSLFTNNSVISDREVLQLMAEDDQFRIYVLNEHLTTEEAEWLLQESNKARIQLVEFLQQEDSGSHIRITVYPPGYGISRAPFKDSITLVGKSWRASTLYHELTHVLTPRSASPFRVEGVAVFAESRLAGSKLPTRPWSVLNATTLALVETLGFPGLQKLDSPGMLHVPLPSQRIVRLRFYWVAGSFTGHLVDTYGWEKYWELYQDGKYEVVYGRTLPELEQEWLAQLATYKRIRYAPLALLGLLCVLLLARAVRQYTPWRRALAVGTPGILAMAAAIVPAPFPALAAILLGLSGLLLGRPRLVQRWPRGVWWTAVILGTTLVIGLIIVPGWNVVLRYA